MNPDFFFLLLKPTNIDVSLTWGIWPLRLITRKPPFQTAESGSPPLCQPPFSSASNPDICLSSLFKRLES